MLDGIPGDYQGHRFDFPGGWSEDKRNAFTVKDRTFVENEVFNYLKALLNYRKNNAVLQTGLMKQFVPENGVYVNFRYNADKTVMIIANNNEKPMDVDCNHFEEMLAGKSSGTEITTSKTYSILSPVSVPAKTVLILEVHE